jgi:hypothetical protein
VVTDRAAALTGRLQAAEGQPASGGAAVVFSAEPSRWTYPSRFVRSAPIQPDGTFNLPSLPPGDYLVAHVGTLDNGWDAPERLEELRPSATRVSLIAGETPTVTLEGDRN